MLKEQGCTETLGCLIVYVDDILLLCEDGQMRTRWLEAVGKIWKLAKEQILIAGDKRNSLSSESTLCYEQMVRCSFHKSDS